MEAVHIQCLPPMRGSALTQRSSPVHPDDPSPQSAVHATPAQLANAVYPNQYFLLTVVHIIVRACACACGAHAYSLCCADMVQQIINPQP